MSHECIVWHSTLEQKCMIKIFIGGGGGGEAEVVNGEGLSWLVRPSLLLRCVIVSL